LFLPRNLQSTMLQRMSPTHQKEGCCGGPALVKYQKRAETGQSRAAPPRMGIICPSDKKFLSCLRISASKQTASFEIAWSLRNRRSSTHPDLNLPFYL